MYLVFGPNEITAIGGRLEELAIAGDLAGAAAECEALRSVAIRLMTALRPIEPSRAASGPAGDTRQPQH
jgi:hypothetical protein